MKQLDLQKLLKRVIIVSWLCLIGCFLIKLFGGNIFEIMCKNENFITICTYADEHKWAFLLNGIVYCFVSLYFFVLAMCQKLKYTKVEFIIFFITLIVVCTVKTFNNTLGLVLDIWQVIIMPMLFVRKTPKKIWGILIGNVLLVLFQLVSMVTRNIDLGVLKDSVLVGNIFSIDVLLMILLYYSYINIINIKKGENSNGNLARLVSKE